MTGNVFEYTVDPNGFIDALRLALFILGAATALAGMVRWLDHVHSWRSAGYVALGVLTSVQELTVLGEPLYPWRLVLLLVMTVCALVAMYQDCLGRSRRD